MSAFPKLQFDTRTKKPKLFLLLLLAGIAGLAVLLLSLGGTERSAVPICGITAAFCLAAFFMLLWAWREQLRYNPYSYNTIYYMGFALFALFVLATNAVLVSRMLRWPELYPADAVMRMLLDSAKQYMLISSPFLLLLSKIQTIKTHLELIVS